MTRLRVPRVDGARVGGSGGRVESGEEGGCKQNDLIDFSAFRAIMNTYLSRHWEEVCGG